MQVEVSRAYSFFTSYVSRKMHSNCTADSSILGGFTYKNAEQSVRGHALNICIC